MSFKIDTSEPGSPRDPVSPSKASKRAYGLASPAKRGLWKMLSDVAISPRKKLAEADHEEVTLAVPAHALELAAATINGARCLISKKSE